MRKQKKLLINLFWLFEILFFIGELIKDGKGVLETLLPAFSAGADSFYFASIGTGVIVLCYVNFDLWVMWRRRAHETRPEIKFKNMYNELQRESNLSLEDVEYRLTGRSQTEKFQAREALRYKLSNLDIPSPISTMVVRDMRWHQFISIMSVYIKDGRLEEAKRLHDNLDSSNSLYDT